MLDDHLKFDLCDDDIFTKSGGRALSSLILKYNVNKKFNCDIVLHIYFTCVSPILSIKPPSEYQVTILSIKYSPLRLSHIILLYEQDNVTQSQRFFLYGSEACGSNKLKNVIKFNPERCAL